MRTWWKLSNVSRRSPLWESVSESLSNSPAPKKTEATEPGAPVFARMPFWKLPDFSGHVGRNENAASPRRRVIDGAQIAIHADFGSGQLVGCHAYQRANLPYRGCAQAVNGPRKLGYEIGIAHDGGCVVCVRQVGKKLGDNFLINRVCRRHCQVGLNSRNQAGGTLNVAAPQNNRRLQPRRVCRLEFNRRRVRVRYCAVREILRRRPGGKSPELRRNQRPA